MESIQSTVIDSKRYALFIALYMVLGTAISMWLAWLLHLFVIVWIGLAVFWVFPLLFQRYYRKRFTRKAVLSFFDDLFQIEIFDKENNQPEKTEKFNYNEIQSFRVFDSSKDDSSSLKIKSRNGTDFAYTFLDQGKGKLQTQISDVIFKYFNQYNSRVEEENKIKLLPNLFATPIGRVLIICVAVLLLISLIMQIVYKPKTIPATVFVSLAFFIIILAQRKRDVEQKKRME